MLIVLITLTEGKLYADPLLSTSSPQGNITRGLINSNADHFMSVADYGKTDFNNWWSVIAYKRQGLIYESGGLAQLGFAGRFGGLYLGLSYIGNGWKDFGLGRGGSFHLNSFTEMTIDGKKWKVFKNDPEMAPASVYELRNEAAVLIGFADMGFKLYYAGNYQENNQNDYATMSPSDSGVTYNYFKSWREEFGSINPGIAWGMTRPLFSRGIKPRVNIDLNFVRDYRMKDDYPDQSDLGSTTGSQIQWSNNKFVPGMDIGLGGFNLTATDNFSLGVDLDYGIRLHLYENEYSYVDAGGKYHTKKLSGSRTRSPSTVADAFEISHSLLPQLKAEWERAGLRLCFRLGVPMTFSATNETSKTVIPDTDGSLERNGLETQSIRYTLNPMIDLAMQWEIIPAVLFLNAGGKLSVFHAIFNTEDLTEYANGVEDTAKRYTRINNSFSPASTVLYLGATWNITKNLELQAALGVGTPNNTVNVFLPSYQTGADGEGRGEGGLINFGNIMLSVKF